MKQQKNEQAKTEARKQRKKNFTIFLVIVCVVVVLWGGIKIYSGSDLKYNNEIKSAYVRTIEALEGVLPYPVTTIDGIRFYEPVAIERPATIEVFATKDERGDGSKLCHYDYFFELAYDYYQALKTAETAGDFQNYVEILNRCFERMELTNESYSYETTNFEFNEQQARQFNELFNLNEYGLNQIGFLPQYVDHASEIKGDTRYVTYTIKGLSFVEVEKGEGDQVLPEDLSNAVLSQKLNKKNIKVYETDFEFTYNLNAELDVGVNDFLISLNEYFSGGKQDAQNLQVTPTNVKEIDLTSFKMQENDFDFEKNK